MGADSDRKGRIQTVCGLIEPQALGPTLMHEHVLWDVTRPEVRARAAAGCLCEVTITLQNHWEINKRSILDYGNQHMQDEAVATAEVERLREDGGGGIVDLSNYGLAPDPLALRRISAATGVPIVQGAGYYVDEYIEEDRKGRSVEALAREIAAQVTEGCWGTDVKAGIIGEIGCMWPLRPFERKVLQASALAQQETGAAINVHPGRHRDAPFEIVDIVKAAGGDVTRLVMSHIDRTFEGVDDALRLAETGCVIEYDFFGIETSYYWFSDRDLPTDYMRVDYIRTLFARGHGAQIVLSHDICTKTRLVEYGGHGYGHMFRNVVPLMRRKGCSEDDIGAMLVENPRRLLTLV
jgi:phosphotriesterase-related protein